MFKKIYYIIPVFTLFIGCSSSNIEIPKIPTKKYNITYNNSDENYIDYKLKKDKNLVYNKNFWIKKSLYIPKYKEKLKQNIYINYKKETTKEIDFYKQKHIIKNFKNKANPMILPFYNIQIGINEKYKTFTLLNNKSYIVFFNNGLKVLPYNKKLKIKKEFSFIIQKKNNNIYLYYKNKKILLKKSINFDLYKNNINLKIIQNKY